MANIEGAPSTARVETFLPSLPRLSYYRLLTVQVTDQLQASVTIAVAAVVEAAADINMTAYLRTC